MALSISRSLVRGVRHSLSRSGSVVLLFTLLSQFFVVSSLNTLIQAALPEELQTHQIGITLPIGNGIAGGLAVVGVILGLMGTVVGVRALTRDRQALNTVSNDLLTYRLGRALLSLVGAGLIVWITVTVGAVLVIPGLFLAVSFVFVPFLVGVEDDRAVSALRQSWRLASGNRWRLFGLLLTAVIAFGVANVITGVVSLIDLAVAQVVNVVITSVLTIVYIGAVGNAFRQLRGTGQR